MKDNVDYEIEQLIKSGLTHEQALNRVYFHSNDSGKTHFSNISNANISSYGQQVQFGNSTPSVYANQNNQSMPFPNQNSTHNYERRNSMTNLTPTNPLIPLPYPQPHFGFIADNESRHIASQQDLLFGMNMFNSVTEQDDSRLSHMISQGISKNDALMIIFEEKCGKPNNGDAPRLPIANNPHRTQSMSSMVPQSKVPYPNGSRNDQSEIDKIMARGYTRELAMQILSQAPRKSTGVTPQQSNTLINPPPFSTPSRNPSPSYSVGSTPSQNYILTTNNQYYPSQSNVQPSELSRMQLPNANSSNNASFANSSSNSSIRSASIPFPSQINIAPNTNYPPNSQQQLQDYGDDDSSQIESYIRKGYNREQAKRLVTENRNSAYVSSSASVASISSTPSTKSLHGTKIANTVVATSAPVSANSTTSFNYYTPTSSHIRSQSNPINPASNSKNAEKNDRVHALNALTGKSDDTDEYLTPAKHLKPDSNTSLTPFITPKTSSRRRSEPAASLTKISEFGSKEDSVSELEGNQRGPSPPRSPITTTSDSSEKQNAISKIAIQEANKLKKTLEDDQKSAEENYRIQKNLFEEKLGQSQSIPNSTTVTPRHSIVSIPAMDRLDDSRKLDLIEESVKNQLKLRETQQDLDRIKEDASKVTLEISQLKERLQQKDSDLANAAKALHEYQLQAMEERGALKAECSILQTRVQLLEKERLDITSTLAQKKEESLFISRDQSNLRESLAQLEDKIRIKDLELTSMRESVMQLEIEKELRAQAENREQIERTERIASVAQLVAIQTEWNHQIKDLEQKKNLHIEKLESEIALLRQDKVMASEKLITQTETIVGLDSEVKQLREALSAATANGQTEFADAIDKIGKLTGELEIMKHKMLETQEKMEIQNKEIAIKTAENEEKLIASEYQRRKLHNLVQELRGNVRVHVRVRPFLPSDGVDLKNLPAPTITIRPDDNSLRIFKVGYSDVKQSAEDQNFIFDKVFGPSISQEEIFTEVSDLVQSALDGYNVCLFSYGQTGSGKTHTMQGSGKGSMRGIIPRAMEQIGLTKLNLEAKGWEIDVSVTFIEIYNETIRDLLVRRPNKNSISNGEEEVKHEVKKDGDAKVYVSDVTMISIDPNDGDQVNNLIETASRHRSTGQTAMNERSSRSHAVFAVHLKSYNSSQNIILNSTLSLVDLAGSERLDRSKVTGTQMKETIEINKSLSALTDVFVAIANKQSHIPFRNSTLTYLLQPALSGDGKTMMMVNLSPTEDSFNESLCSLRLAKQINQVELGRAKKQVTKQSSRTLVSSSPSSGSLTNLQQNSIRSKRNVDIK